MLLSRLYSELLAKYMVSDLGVRLWLSTLHFSYKQVKGPTE